jgi:hypothetical protein
MNVVELTLSLHVESFVMGLALGAAFPKAARSVLNSYQSRTSGSDENRDTRERGE